MTLRICARTRAVLARRLSIAFLAAAFSGVDSIAAQCSTPWLPGEGGPPGVTGDNGRVCASTLWDPDGNGPRGPLLVLGGNFLFAGDVPCARIATYDLETGEWAPLGSGMNEAVWALTTSPQGDLIAGGEFTSAGDVPDTRYIARWDGTGWSALGTGAGGIVFALTTFNGQLVVGGRFAAAGGIPANNIAIFGSNTWAPLGNGSSGEVRALAHHGNNLVVGGIFSTAGGVLANSIALWDGSTWSPLGLGVTSGANPGSVLAITVANGRIFAGGSFTTAGTVTAHRIAQWNSGSWSPVGAGFNASGAAVNALVTLPNGDVVAGGTLWIPFVFSYGVMRWNGNAWSEMNEAMGPPSEYVRTLSVLADGDLIAGGVFPRIRGGTVNNVARWDSTTTHWRALVRGLNGTVTGSNGVPNGVKAITTLSDGATVIGGQVAAAAGVDVSNIALRSGSRWLPMGSGMNNTVFALARMHNGDVVAGGYFTSAGGAPDTTHIAQWNGAGWSALGGGMDNHVFALLTLSDGRLLAGGRFATAGGVSANRIAVWNGTWTALGAGMDDRVLSLAEAPNGDLFAGGRFTSAGGAPASRIARWRNGAWTQVGAGLDGDVLALAVLPSGNLVAGGAFNFSGSTPLPRIALWDGSAWSPLGAGLNGDVHALHVLPDGDVVAGGRFTMAGGGSAVNLARLHGTTWSAFGAGLDVDARALLALPNGDLEVGGDFTTADGAPSTFVARLTTTCPASAAPIATTCTGMAGPVTLTADTLPWIGGTFRATARGFGNGAIAFAMLGFASPATPLGQVTPLALPGCDLLATPDSVVFLVPTGGTASWQVAIPNLPTWSAVPLYHQYLQLEVAPPPAPSALSASNGLALVTGTF